MMMVMMAHACLVPNRLFSHPCVTTLLFCVLPRASEGVELQENEWGITLEDDSEPSSSSAPAPAAAPTGQSNLPEGVSFAYQVQSDAGNADDNVKVAEGADVDDLQAMLKSLHSK